MNREEEKSIFDHEVQRKKQDYPHESIQKCSTSSDPLLFDMISKNFKLQTVPSHLEHLEVKEFPNRKQIPSFFSQWLINVLSI